MAANITRTHFRNNTAARGAISVSSNVEVIIINCSFQEIEQLPQKDGGAIESSQSDITFYRKSNLTNNTAVNSGAVSILCS